MSVDTSPHPVVGAQLAATVHCSRAAASFFPTRFGDHWEDRDQADALLVAAAWLARKGWHEESKVARKLADVLVWGPSLADGRHGRLDTVEDRGAAFYARSVWCTVVESLADDLMHLLGAVTDH